MTDPERALCTSSPRGGSSGEQHDRSAIARRYGTTRSIVDSWSGAPVTYKAGDRWLLSLLPFCVFPDRRVRTASIENVRREASTMLAKEIWDRASLQAMLVGPVLVVFLYVCSA